MAIVEYGGGVSAFHKSIGGTTFARSGIFSVARSKSVGRKTSVNQALNTMAGGLAATEWKRLSVADKAAFETQAQYFTSSSHGYKILWSGHEVYTLYRTLYLHIPNFGTTWFTNILESQSPLAKENSVINDAGVFKFFLDTAPGSFYDVYGGWLISYAGPFTSPQRLWKSYSWKYAGHRPQNSGIHFTLQYQPIITSGTYYVFKTRGIYLRFSDKYMKIDMERRNEIGL